MEITVSGRHTLSIFPERATLQISAGFEGAKMAENVRNTHLLVNEISAELDRLKRLNPAPITWFSVEGLRTYSYSPSPDNPRTLHVASHQVKVKFCDFTALADFTATWGKRRGMRLLGIDWDVTEKTKHSQKKTVLQLAVRDAFTRAEIIAAAAGAGEITCQEITDPGLMPHRDCPNLGYQTSLAARHAQLPEDEETPQLVPEHIELSAQVYARFSTTAAAPK